MTTTIVYAAFGMNGSYYDVTSIIASNYASGTRTFYPSIATYGDPDPNVLKNLYIVYGIGTANQNNPPGSTVLYSQAATEAANSYTNTSPQQISIPSGAWIVYAAYGMSTSYYDVTAQVQNAYAGGTSTFSASTSTWGPTDPDPNVLKSLYIVYGLNSGGSKAPGAAQLYSQSTLEPANDYTANQISITLP